MNALRWLGGAALVLALVVVGIWAVGASLPRSHVASVEATYPNAPAEVWDAISDARSMPSWRSNVEDVELVDGRTGPVAPGARWRETGPRGSHTLEVTTADPPRRLVTRIAERNLPYAGSWEYRVRAGKEGAATLTITERGEVHDPFFRFMARFVFGYEGTARTYLTDLGRHLGHEVEPRSVEVP